MKKHIVLVIFLVLIVGAIFSNTLGHNFIGDDHLLFTNNTFYRSWENIRRLVQKDYFTNSNDAYLQIYADLGSGSVGYRPVVSLTYFLNYHFCGVKPFGYHLVNYLLHIFNGVLVYFCLFLILKNRVTAFFTAILFGVHPIVAEAVNNIGFRADLLATFFVLGSLLLYLLYREDPQGKRVLYKLSVVAFFLALFSKESVAVYPFIVMLLDYSFPVRGEQDSPTRLRAYAGFFVVLAFYLIVYLGVFPNQTLKGIHLFGHSLVIHFLTITRLFWIYLVSVFCPWLVFPVPALYRPEVIPILSWANVLSMGGTLIYGIILVSCFKRHKEIFFFLAWYALFFLPVSNIIPIVNPMAYRFMYLPSIGLITIAGLVLESLNGWPLYARLQKTIRIILVLFLSMLTFGLNTVWQSDFTYSLAMIDKYPSNPRAYHQLGIVYAKEKQYTVARWYFQKSIDLDPLHPVYYRDLAVSYVNAPQKAIVLLKKAINLRPDYQRAKLDLCRAYANARQFGKAQKCFEKILRYEPSADVYADYIKLLGLMGKEAQAQELLQEARKEYPGDALLKEGRLLPVKAKKNQTE